jgi:hypothetical protein
MNVYTDNGFRDRQHYLESLAEDYDVELETVEALADVLGEDEDFDGLLVALEDA